MFRAVGGLAGDNPGLGVRGCQGHFAGRITLPGGFACGDGREFESFLRVFMRKIMGLHIMDGDRLSR